MSTFPSRFSSELLLEVLSQANTATAIHSTDEMIIETANDAMIAIWGKDKSVIGKPIEEALPELKGQPFLKMLQSVLHTGITQSGTNTRADLVVNGVLTPFYFDFEYRAIKNIDGEIICVLHTAVDVTERYLSRLRELELESELQAMNEELAAANEELAAANDAMVAANEELAVTNEELLATNEELNQSQRNLLQVNSTLAQSEARFRMLVKEAPVAIAIVSGDNLIFESVNDSMLRLLVRGPEIIGMPYIEALPEMKQQPYWQMLKDAYTTGEVISRNEAKAIISEVGVLNERYFNFVYQPIKNTDGTTTGVMIVAMDVTAQVEDRLSLQQSRARLNSMVMTAPIGMTVLRGRDMVIEIANNPMYEIWNRTSEQAIGKKLMDVFPELEGQPFPALLANVFETGNRLAIPEIPVEIVTPAGNVNYIINFAYDPLFDLDGKVESILTTVINITDQVSAREELQKARDILKQAIDSAEMGTWSFDIVTGELVISGKGKTIHGIYPDAQISLQDIFDVVVPGHLERVKGLITNAISIKNSFEVEYIINTPDGGKQRWVKTTGRAYYDDNNNPLSISGTMIDITESKAYDQQKDDFISIASHELKTPVTSLKAALQLLDRMKDNPSPVMFPKLIEQSNRSMDKISNLIEDLLNLSRMNEGQLKLNKTKFTLAGMLNLCCSHVRMAGKHEFVLTGDRTLEIIADEHRIDQVIVNMVNNVVKYAPNSKEIIFNIERVGNSARISVTDTGPGIPAEKLAHLFERYYRTDAAGYQNSGLGLGLFISAEIIRKHGGEIGVESEVGKGSTFWFTLPLN
jgi:PAS domain S-box-containing protein